MARMLTGTLTLGLALGLTGIVVAQEQPKGIIGIGTMVFHPDIQKELKLSDEQTGKLKESLGKVMAKYENDFAKFQKSPPKSEEVEKVSKAFTDDSRTAIAGVLDAKQMKRFQQILWQLIGATALLDPELHKELKLSNEQKMKLEEVFKDRTKKILEMQKAGELSKEKYDAVIKDTEQKANGVLTEEQQKSYKELKGPKFEISPPPPPKKQKSA